MIFFEGADGSGKTTLIQQLIDEYGYNSLITPPQRKPKKVTEEEDWDYFMDKVKPIHFCDRGILTELVYRQVDGEVSWLHGAAHALTLLQGHMIVYCKTNTAYADAMARGENHILDEKVHKKIVKEYDRVTKFIQLYDNVAVITYDWQKDDILEVVKAINLYITGGVNAVRQLYNS